MSVYLVGAGPGDPGLMTVQGLELVRSCDVLVYDRLVASELVAEAPSDAILVSRDPLSQEEVNAALVAYGRRGLTVVRLKGGDPFVFGRGAEEALALAEARVPFQIVPGVSSLAAVPAAAGIPVTHRGISSQVTVVSGRGSALDYGSLARARGTLVLFMGLGTLEEIAAGLLSAGRDASTPAAVISCGTRAEQEVIVASLGEIAGAAADLEPPALVVVGEVVALRERITAAAANRAGLIANSSERS